MKIPMVIIAVVLTAMLAVEGWTLIEVVNLKVAVAELAARLAQSEHLRPRS